MTNYLGKLGRNLVSVDTFPEGIALTKDYGSHLRMKWSFGNDGRIREVNSLINPYEEKSCILRVKKPEEQKWTEMLARYGPIVGGEELEHNVRSLPPKKKYQAILCTGHKLAEEVLRSIRLGKTKDLEKLARNQHPLTSIVRERSAGDRIHQVCSIIPIISQFGPETLTIRYHPAYGTSPVITH